jgi:hypothetical protein
MTVVRRSLWLGRSSGAGVNRRKSRGRALLVALGVILRAANAVAQQAPPPATEKESPSNTPALEPTIEVLKASSRRLASARLMSFTAIVSYERPSRPGPPLAYTRKSTVTLQRPDKLRVITPGDGPASEFYYDGKTKEVGDQLKVAFRKQGWSSSLMIHA